MISVQDLDVYSYVGPYGTDIALAYVEYIQKSSVPKPMISYEVSSYLLNSSTTYPYFLRTIQPDGLQASAIAIYIQSLGFKKVGVIYTNDDIGVGIYNSFNLNAGTLQITILNDVNKQAIDYMINSDGAVSQTTKDSIGIALDEIIAQQLKVIVYLGGSDITTEIAVQAYQRQLYGSNYF